MVMGRIFAAFVSLRYGVFPCSFPFQPVGTLNHLISLFSRENAHSTEADASQGS